MNIEFAQEIVEFAMKILCTYGKRNGDLYYFRGLQTDVGSMHFFVDSISFAPKFHNHQGDWVKFRGSLVNTEGDIWTFRVDSYEGDLHLVAQIVEAIALNVIANGVAQGVPGCFGRLKKMLAELA